MAWDPYIWGVWLERGESSGSVTGVLLVMGRVLCRRFVSLCLSAWCLFSGGTELQTEGLVSFVRLAGVCWMARVAGSVEKRRVTPCPGPKALRCVRGPEVRGRRERERPTECSLQVRRTWYSHLLALERDGVLSFPPTFLFAAVHLLLVAIPGKQAACLGGVLQSPPSLRTVSHTGFVLGQAQLQRDF